MKTISVTIPAFITGAYPLSDLVCEEDDKRIASRLVYWHPYDEGTFPDGWTRIGSADITIKFDDPKDIITGQVETLRNMKKAVQSEAQRKITELDEQIGKLLCLEHKQDGD